MRALLALDGNNFTHRVWNAMAYRTGDADAEAVIQTVLGLIGRWCGQIQIPPHQTVVAFDGERGATWRRALYPGYKAGRGEKRQSLVDALATIGVACAGMGLRVRTHPDAEADDLLATLAHRAAQRQIPTTIVTGDGDLLQTIGPFCRVGLLGNTAGAIRWWDEGEFYEEYGFGPHRFADYKALVGDTSDALPGVKGIGPVAAKKLVAHYGGIEAILLAARQWTPGEPGPLTVPLAALLNTQRETAATMYRIVRLVHTLPLD